MEISNLIPHIESLIFASDRPLTALEITDLINNAFGFMEDKIVEEQVEAALQGIVEKYGSEFYPFEIKQSGGGWQFLTKKEFHKTVAQLNGEKFLKRLSAATLETLAIIAYKQPITKGEIEAIRGVSSDYSIQKLLEKELIIISGRNENLPGHPLVYTTSKNFMDYFGINSPEDLPKIKEVLADQVVEPTVVQGAGPETEVEQSESLSVSDNGELVDILPVTEPEINGHSFEQHEEDAAPPEEEQMPAENDMEQAQEDETDENEINEEDETADLDQPAALDSDDDEPFAESEEREMNEEAGEDADQIEDETDEDPTSSDESPEISQDEEDPDQPEQ